jgi:hypothetical protein
MNIGKKDGNKINLCGTSALPRFFSNCAFVAYFGTRFLLGRDNVSLPVEMSSIFDFDFVLFGLIRHTLDPNLIITGFARSVTRAGASSWKIGDDH